VRRGFLGTVRSEANAVATVVESLALSRPGIGFYLRSDGRRSLALPAAADLRERVAQVHGLSLARSLIALEDPVVWGFVSPLAVSFPTRHYLHVAVNGRVVEADSFAPAVAKAYADLLPKGRHPAPFLRLELGPGEVDVNVHPAKSAVRLRGGRSAYPLVVGTIRAALAQERTVGGVCWPRICSGNCPGWSWCGRTGRTRAGSASGSKRSAGGGWRCLATETASSGATDWRRSRAGPRTCGRLAWWRLLGT
jgi:DNA mismatch repair protein MutL